MAEPEVEPRFSNSVLGSLLYYVAKDGIEEIRFSVE